MFCKNLSQCISKALADLTIEKDGIVLKSFENGVATLSAVAGSFTVNATLK